MSETSRPIADDRADFAAEVERNIAGLGADPDLRPLAARFLEETLKLRYNYNFAWMGLPIIQYPQDMAAMQEIIWATRPTTIIEAGVARGGSLVFYASLLEMMGVDGGRVIGVDIDIRPHNRAAIESHPMSKRIALVQGSSTAPETLAQVRRLAGPGPTLVCLDSMHTHDHVLEELRLYSPLVTPGGYLVVFDTIIEMLPKSLYADRPWGPGDNPFTAVQAFLKENDAFEVDQRMIDKLAVTCCPGGYLKRRSPAG